MYDYLRRVYWGRNVGISLPMVLAFAAVLTIGVLATVILATRRVAEDGELRDLSAGRRHGAYGVHVQVRLGAVAASCDDVVAHCLLAVTPARDSDPDGARRGPGLCLS